MKIDGYKDREVLMVTYEFDQSTDVEGQMAGIPRGGKIRVRVKALNDGTPRGGRLTVRVKALNDGNSQMLQWMLAPNDPRDFKVTFFNTVDGSTMKEHGDLRAR